LPADALAEQLRTIATGHKVFDADLLMAGIGDWDPLTEREKRALRLAKQGLSTADIAQPMCLTEGTVRNCLPNPSANSTPTHGSKRRTWRGKKVGFREADRLLTRNFKRSD
jgi:hypothetical protein